VSIVRSPTFFESVRISITSLPDGWTRTPFAASLLGWTANTGRLSVVVPQDTPLGRYDIGVQATNQGRTTTTTVSVEVVQDVPTAGAPTASLLSGVKMGQTALTVRVAWPAATDPTSAIAGYEVEASENGGPWMSTVARSAAQRDAAYTVKFDIPYQFRVRARDQAGNWSPWVVSTAPTRIHPVDDRSLSITRSGYWLRRASATAWRTTVTGSSRAGATLTMTFTGRGIAVVGPKNPHRGKAKVYIDGAFYGTINMRSTAWTSRQVAFTWAFAAGGTHRITLRVVGGGTYPLFRLDAFVVSR
jgi:hypothetical protein